MLGNVEQSLQSVNMLNQITQQMNQTQQQFQQQQQGQRHNKLTTNLVNKVLVNQNQQNSYQ